MKKVLVAEDESSIVTSLEFLLKAAGYEVTVALDGAEALRVIATAHPDLVVLDIMLPSVSGFEVCRQIRGEQALKDTKILILTARGRESEIDRGIAAGANAYMTKPFATRELMRVVGELLGCQEPLTKGS